MIVDRSHARAIAAWLLLTAGCGSRVSERGSGNAYPPTRTVDVVDTWHGTTVPDPYRWLEDLASPEVRAWAAAQTTAAQPFLQDSVLRAWFAARIEVHAAGWDAFEASTPPPPPSTRVELRLDADSAAQRQHIVAARADGSKRIIVDPSNWPAARTISSVTPAPDGKHALFSISTDGSEWVETRIARVANTTVLSDSLDGLRFAEPVWTRDGRGFFYVKYERPRAGESVALREPSLWYHRLGTAQGGDRAIYRTAPDNIQFLLGVVLAPDGRHLVITEGTGAATDGLGQLVSRMMLLDLRDALVPDVTGTLTSLSAAPDFGYKLVGQGSDGALHVLTDRDAPRRRLVAIDLRDPDVAHWRDVIPQHADVLHELQVVGNHYVAHYLRDAQSVVRVYASDGRLEHTIELPSFSKLMDVREGASSDELMVASMTFLEPPVWCRVTLSSGVITVVPRSARHELIGGEYETSRVRYPSKDGTLIPMFLVHRRGLVRDGSHPVILHGYGASHDPSLPEYSEAVLAWLELGGVFAMPNLRGGGEFGRDWYEAAILGRKQTTYDDFIAAAEWLVRERWTASDRLAIEGASNGGLLVSVAMTQRPELFAAAVAKVPSTDMLRFEFGRHTAQFGTPHDSAQFGFMYAYSPLHHVQPGTCYPATLLTTAFNDERVPAWNAFKFAAALQAAQGCDRPIALRADNAGGHGNVSGDAWLEHELDWMTFVARAVGVTRVPASPSSNK